MTKFLKKRRLVMSASMALLLFSSPIAKFLRVETMAEDDQGQISITAKVRLGMKIDEVDYVMKQIEDIISQQEGVESYIILVGSSGSNMSSDSSIAVHLKEDREMETDQVARLWRQQLGGISDTNIAVEAHLQVSTMMGSGDEYSMDFRNMNYDDLKVASDHMAENLSKRPELTKVHSSLEDAAFIVKVTANPIRARAAGLTPAQVGDTPNNILSGITPTSLNIDRNDIDVKVKYPKERYRTPDQIETITFQMPKGSSATLTDVIDIHFAGSSAFITGQDKQCHAIISGIYTENSDKNTENRLLNEAVQPVVSDNANATIARNQMDESMTEELMALFQTAAPAIFLVFVVMATRFGSPKFSIMVMTTIPPYLIDASGFLWPADNAISMTSLPGFLMLVGTVVSNGILYTDTVNQYYREMDSDTTLVETGMTRLRPILATTLATVMPTVSMALILGGSGFTTQGPAPVSIGGLTAPIIFLLLMLPAYHSLMNGGDKKWMVIVDQPETSGSGRALKRC